MKPRYLPIETVGRMKETTLVAENAGRIALLERSPFSTSQEELVASSPNAHLKNGFALAKRFLEDITGSHNDPESRLPSVYLLDKTQSREHHAQHVMFCVALGIPAVDACTENSQYLRNLREDFWDDTRAIAAKPVISLGSALDNAWLLRVPGFEDTEVIRDTMVYHEDQLDPMLILPVHSAGQLKTPQLAQAYNVADLAGKPHSYNYQFVARNF